MSTKTNTNTNTKTDTSNTTIRTLLRMLALAAVLGSALVTGTASTASAATNCGGSGGVYPDDCYYPVYYGSNYHRGEVRYSSGWSASVLVKDAGGDSFCTTLQSRARRGDGTWTAWSSEGSLCSGRSATLSPHGFHPGDVQFRLVVGGVAGAQVTCVRGSDGTELCR